MLASKYGIFLLLSVDLEHLPVLLSSELGCHLLSVDSVLLHGVVLGLLPVGLLIQSVDVLVNLNIVSFPSTSGVELDVEVGSSLLISLDVVRHSAGVLEI